MIIDMYIMKVNPTCAFSKIKSEILQRSVGQKSIIITRMVNKVINCNGSRLWIAFVKAIRITLLQETYFDNCKTHGSNAWGADLCLTLTHLYWYLLLLPHSTSQIRQENWCYQHWQDICYCYTTTSVSVSVFCHSATLVTRSKY